jgi:hypothetical protein
MDNEEYFFKEQADIVVEDLKEGINIEQKIIVSEHNLENKLLAIHLIFEHLEERISPEEKDVYDFFHRISDKIQNIENTIKEQKLQNIRIIKKDKSQNWSTVRAKWRIPFTIKYIKNRVVVLETELKALHVKFSELLQFMDEHELMKALKEDHATPKEIEEFEKAEHYYFSQIRRFFRAYENIIAQLLSELQTQLK